MHIPSKSEKQMMYEKENIIPCLETGKTLRFAEVNKIHEYIKR